jgi:hypothetical protein
MAAEVGGEVRRTGEDLGKPDRDVLDVGGGEVGEDGGEVGVGQDGFVEGVAQPAQASVPPTAS